MKLYLFVFTLLCVFLQVFSYCDNKCKPRRATHGKHFCIKSKPKKFTQCSHGRRYEFRCPKGLVFNQQLSRCDWTAPPCQCDGDSGPTTTTMASSSISMTTGTSTTTKKSTTPSTTTTPGSGTPSSKSSICYYTNWSQYRSGKGSFKPNKIDVSLCSHIIYAFLNFDATSVTNREWNDANMIKQIVDKKQQKPSLKVIASIGGWNAGTAAFRQIIATSSSRSAFNKAAIKYLRDNNFDGFDVDFEYPGDASRGSPPSDKPKFTAWMQSLRSDFDAEAAQTGKPRLILGIAIAAGKQKIDSGYDVPAISQALDFISVMSYDYHGSWDSVTGFNAPLHPKSSWPQNSGLAQFTTSFTVDYLINKGAPASKLMMGIPLYGRTFKLSNAGNAGVGALASGAGRVGKYTGEAGFNSYYETCMLSKCSTTPYDYTFDSETMTPYMSQGTNWITTEDVQSVQSKAEFAMQRNLGGVMFWAIDLDDFSDMCKNGVKYPLMKTALNTLDGNNPPTLTTGNLSPAMCNAVN